MSRFVEPVTLTGSRWVRLEPLNADHVDEIAAAATDGDPGGLWFMMAPSPETAGAWVSRMLALQAAGGLTFLVGRLDGPPIGSSSYLNVDGPNRRLEIGATWYSAECAGTVVREVSTRTFPRWLPPRRSIGLRRQTTTRPSPPDRADACRGSP